MWPLLGRGHRHPTSLYNTPPVRHFSPPWSLSPGSPAESPLLAALAPICVPQLGDYLKTSRISILSSRPSKPSACASSRTARSWGQVHPGTSATRGRACDAPTTEPTGHQLCFIPSIDHNWTVFHLPGYPPVIPPSTCPSVRPSIRLLVNLHLQQVLTSSLFHPPPSHLWSRAILPHCSLVYSGQRNNKHVFFLI